MAIDDWVGRRKGMMKREFARLEGGGGVEVLQILRAACEWVAAR
jgi:hypothetical protein